MAEITVGRSYFGNELIIRKDDKKYLNLPLLFPENRYNSPLKFTLKNDDIKVFYDYKYSHSLKHLIFSKCIELNKDFLVGLGIYLAEGARNRHPKITNSQPIIINQGIRFFELFNFNKKDFKVWIQLHERSSKPFKEVKKFWIKNTKLDKKNIKRIRIKKSMGNAEVEPYGTLHLEVSYLLFKILVNNLLGLVPKIIKELSKEQLIWFLQGVYAGEGYVGLAKSGSVNTIGYTSTRENERDLIKNILIKFNVKVNEDEKENNLDIFGYFNIKKLYDLNIFEYHPYRKLRLQKGLSSLEKSRIPKFNKNKILNLLRKEKYLTISQISNELGLKYRNTAKHLRELNIKDEVNKIEGSGPIPIKWFI